MVAPLSSSLSFHMFLGHGMFLLSFLLFLLNNGANFVVGATSEFNNDNNNRYEYDKNAFNSVNSEIDLEVFENAIHKWKQMNDPVMGGKSTGTFSIENGIGLFQGEVVNVPFLNAPGFIKASTININNPPFPDISSCQAIQLELMAKEQYDGYRFSFGHAHAPGGKYFAFGYKATLTNVPIGEYGTVVIPLDDFTDFWDDATGDPIHTCKENSLYCPDELTLKNMQEMAIWAEGVAGNVELSLKSIKAIECFE